MYAALFSWPVCFLELSLEPENVLVSICFRVETWLLLSLLSGLRV
ncbi:hypothetical protein SynROS8604_00164 [Synechococcus sp. ROS8604]|nr:hypothetical protein SynROS8604_00164 [Synechococcus sp. ROS8604]